MKKYILILILLGVSILGLSACSLMSQSQDTTQTASPATDKAVVEAVNIYYKSYDSCMKNPPAGSEGKVSEFCQNNTGLTTAAFAGNLEAGGTAKAGADPVFCAQDIPETFSANADAQIINDKAIATVSEKFGATQMYIKVELANENGTWKIDNIICPAP